MSDEFARAGFEIRPGDAAEGSVIPGDEMKVVTRDQEIPHSSLREGLQIPPEESAPPEKTVPPEQKGAFGRNIAANLANAALSIFVGAWFTPYLVRHLGVAAYGLVPLTTSVALYLGLVTVALNSSVARYLTIALERGDDLRAGKVLSTSVFSSAAVALVMLIPGTWLAMNGDRYFHVPPGFESQFRLLLLCGIIAFAVTTVGSSFEAISLCRNRFDLRSIVSISGTVVRVGLVVLLFSLISPRLWHVGLGLVCGAAVAFIGAVVVRRVLTPGLAVRARDFDASVMKDLVSTGGWIVIDQVGTLLLLAVDLIVVNRLLGPEAGGQYAAVLQWPVLLRGIAGTIAAVFGPTTLYYYARKDMDGLARYCRWTMRLLGVVTALLIGLVCGLSKPLLQAWLGKEFVPLAPLMSLMTIHLCVSLAVQPLFIVQVATNRVRWPGIVTCVMGLANLGLAILLAGPVGWGMYGVAAAGAIALTVRSSIFVPLYVAHIIGRRWSTFYREMVLIVGLTLGVTAVCYCGARVFDLASWIRIIPFGLAVSVFYAGFAYVLVLRECLKNSL